MGFQLKGTVEKVKEVSTTLKGVMLGKGPTVKVEAKKDKKKKDGRG